MVETDATGWQSFVGLVLTIAIIACLPWLISTAKTPKPPVVPTTKMVTPSSVGF